MSLIGAIIQNVNVKLEIFDKITKEKLILQNHNETTVIGHAITGQKFNVDLATPNSGLTIATSSGSVTVPTYNISSQSSNDYDEINKKYIGFFSIGEDESVASPADIVKQNDLQSLIYFNDSAIADNTNVWTAPSGHTAGYLQREGGSQYFYHKDTINNVYYRKAKEISLSTTTIYGDVSNPSLKTITIGDRQLQLAGIEYKYSGLIAENECNISPTTHNNPQVKEAALWMGRLLREVTTPSDLIYFWDGGYINGHYNASPYYLNESNLWMYARVTFPVFSKTPTRTINLTWEVGNYTVIAIN
jgi:hypothetical protein